MKKLVVAIILIAGFTGIAQDREMRSKRGGMNDYTPEQVATLQTKKMTLALDLNEQQQTKMKTLLMEDASQRKAQREERKANKDQNKTITSEERYASQNDRLDRQLARKKEMKSILNAEQYAKWEKMQHRFTSNRGGKNGMRQGNRKRGKRG